MYVKVVSRFRHRKTGKYHDPGKMVNLTADYATHLAKAGCVEVVTGKEPSENKAKVPTENKGAG